MVSSLDSDSFFPLYALQKCTPPHDRRNPSYQRQDKTTPPSSREVYVAVPAPVAQQESKVFQPNLNIYQTRSPVCRRIVRYLYVAGLLLGGLIGVGTLAASAALGSLPLVSMIVIGVCMALVIGIASLLLCSSSTHAEKIGKEVCRLEQENAKLSAVVLQLQKQISDSEELYKLLKIYGSDLGLHINNLDDYTKNLNDKIKQFGVLNTDMASSVEACTALLTALNHLLSDKHIQALAANSQALQKKVDDLEHLIIKQEQLLETLKNQTTVQQEVVHSLSNQRRVQEDIVSDLKSATDDLKLTMSRLKEVSVSEIETVF